MSACPCRPGPRQTAMQQSAEAHTSQHKKSESSCVARFWIFAARDIGQSFLTMKSEDGRGSECHPWASYPNATAALDS